MARGRKLSREEIELWRRVAGDVQRLPGRLLPEIEEENSSNPVIAPTPSSPQASVGGGPAPVRRALGPAMDRGKERRVRRGDLAIAAKLDLHGYDYDSARGALKDFLARQVGSHAQIVLVITGKGGGVLRRALPNFLSEPALRSLVGGYSTAHRSHGGEGAYYVFLKRKP